MSREYSKDELEVANRVKRALLELQVFASSRNVDDYLGKSVDALVAAGAFSAETAAFIASHWVRFYGFNAGRIGSQIPVLDVALADSTPPFRVVGFRDGHVEMVPVGRAL